MQTETPKTFVLYQVRYDWHHAQPSHTKTHVYSFQTTDFVFERLRIYMGKRHIKNKMKASFVFWREINIMSQETFCQGILLSGKVSLFYSCKSQRQKMM